VPIAVNCAKHWPRKAFVKTPGVIDVVIGPQISSVGRTPEEMMCEVENWIEAKTRELDPQADGSPS
jgi:1-acyl-sn-glycerol-3-phosphate acyltransferase